MSDFIAAQDQSYSAALERIGRHPQQFVLAWYEEDKGNIGVLMFAQPEFIIKTIEKLTEGLMFNEPTVGLPPE